MGENDGKDVGSAEIVTLKLNAAYEEDSRSVTVSAPAIKQYELYGSVSGDQTLLGSWTDLASASVSLVTGNWNFTLKAFSSTDSSAQVLEGTLANQAISAAGTLSFALSTITGGTGSVAVTLRWPVAGNSVQSVLISYGDATLKVNAASFATVDGTYSVSYENASAAAGNTVLVFSLMDAADGAGNLVSSVTEVVCVRKNLTSAKTVTLTAADMNCAPTAPTGFGAASVANSTASAATTVTLSWTDASNNETGFALQYSDDARATWTDLPAASAAATSASDSVARGVTRVYRIRSANSLGASAWVETSATIPYLVTFDSKDGSAVAAQEVAPTGLVTAPSAPTRANYAFGGWYKESACANAWVFATDAISANTTLFAKWSDTTAPTVGTGISFTGTGENGTTVNWGAASDAITAPASLSYKIVRASTAGAIDTVIEANAITTSGAGMAMDWTANATTKAVTALTASTAYYFAVLVKDGAGNMALYAPALVTTSATADITAPTLSSVSVLSVADTNASLTATSNEAGMVYYVITGSATAPSKAQIIAGKNEFGAAPFTFGYATATAASARNFAVTGLSAFAKYYYHVVATDAAANQSDIVSGSFATIGSGCLARYGFDSAMTDSVGAHDLTGTASYSTTTTKHGTAAAYLDGTKCLSTSILLTSTGVSVSAWVNLDDDVGYGLYPEVFKIAKDNGNYLELYDIADTAPHTFATGASIGSSGSSTVTKTTAEFSTGIWAFVTVTYNASGDYILYVNGVYSDTNNGGANPLAGVCTLLIGSDSADPGAAFCYWKGHIDDVQVYNRALAASEISALYATY